MRPDIADRPPVQALARGPDRRERRQQLDQQLGGLQRRRGARALARARGQPVEQAAGAAVVAEALGLRRHHRAEPAQQRRAPLQADERIVRPDLEDGGQRRGLHPAERAGVDPAGLVRPRREGTGREGAQRRHRQAFRARQALAGLGLVVMPVGAGAGIEQHADQREIDARTRQAGTAERAQQRVDLVLAVDAAGLEMAPAAVIRDLQVGESPARQGGDALRDGRQRAAVEAEVRRVAALHRGGDRMAAPPHGGRVVQHRQRVGAMVFTQGRAPSRRPDPPRPAPRRW